MSSTTLRVHSNYADDVVVNVPTELLSSAYGAAYDEDRLMVVGNHAYFGWVFRDAEDALVGELENSFRVHSSGPQEGDAVEVGEIVNPVQTTLEIGGEEFECVPSQAEAEADELIEWEVRRHPWNDATARRQESVTYTWRTLRALADGGNLAEKIEGQLEAAE